VALAPDLAVAHKNLGLALLHEEQYAEGWREYEWRWKADQLTPRSYPKPMWQGGPVAGKTVLLFAEQGLGDAIHFARFATVLAQAGARVVLEAHPPLVRLMSRLQGVAQVMPLNGTPPAFDCFQALMSVPGILGVNATNIPVGAYLTAEPERVAAWRARIGAHGFKVGIVWQGKGTTPSERARSTAIQSFAPLAAIPGVRLISLQKQSDAGDVDLARIPVETLGADFDSGPDAFLDTAAVMASLDLVVTIDTSIAHLAGALGRPVWIALKHVPDWRWTMHGTGSRWYPNARLFRQPTVGDWSTPFNEIAATLGAVTKRVAS
jgi:hypothetical protein